jgi:hypothetical protein
MPTNVRLKEAGSKRFEIFFVLFFLNSFLPSQERFLAQSPDQLFNEGIESLTRYVDKAKRCFEASSGEDAKFFLQVIDTAEGES